MRRRAVSGCSSVMLVAATIATNPPNNMHPCWLPDGKSIAFESDRDGDSEIFVMELASRRIVQLTKNDAFDGMPLWLSDSIVFQSDRDGDSKWFAMDLDGGNPRLLGEDIPDSSTSLDGSTVVFSADSQNGLAIFRRNQDGTETRLSNHRHAEQPDLSPDGGTIVYEVRDTTPAGVYTMSLDGSNMKRIANGTDPSWSPDGKRILFKSLDVADQWVISLVDADGSGLRQYGEGVHPSFSPDGKRILYMSETGAPESIWQIHVMRADGSGDECLTCPSR